MNKREQTKSVLESVRRLGTFAAVFAVLYFTVTSHKQIAESSAMRAFVTQAWGYLEDIREISSGFSEMEKDPFADDLHRIVKDGAPSVTFGERAVDYLVEEKCRHVDTNALMCDVGFAEGMLCSTIKKQESDCNYWVSVKARNETLDSYTLKVALSDAWGIKHNNTHFTPIEKSEFGSAQYSMRLRQINAAMVRGFKKIERKASMLAGMMKNMASIGAYTKSFDDYISFYSGGNIGASKIVYVGIAFIGIPVHFVGYFIFCVLVEYNDFGVGRDIVTTSGIETLGNVFGERTWLAVLRLFYIDLWGLLFVEIVAFLTCYYMEYCSPLYFILKTFGNGIKKLMERHREIHDTFSAFPAFLLGVLEAFRWMCCGIIIVSMSARFFVFSVVVSFTTFKLLLSTGAIGIGIVSTLAMHIRKRSGIYTFLTALLFLVLETHAGTDFRALGELIPQDMGEFSLKNYAILVPGILRRMFFSLPENTKYGLYAILGFAFMHIARDAAGAIITANPQMAVFRTTNYVFPRTFRVACRIESTISNAISVIKIAFWLFSLVSPFLGQFEITKNLLGGLFASEGWLLHATKMFLLYLSPSN